MQALARAPMASAAANTHTQRMQALPRVPARGRVAGSLVGATSASAATVPNQLPRRLAVPRSAAASAGASTSGAEEAGTHEARCDRKAQACCPAVHHLCA
jgi:hypothetical protein